VSQTALAVAKNANAKKNNNALTIVAGARQILFHCQFMLYICKSYKIVLMKKRGIVRLTRVGLS